jgi:protein-S-isoprenylcysteine O-methyltransferase Ste14
MTDTVRDRGAAVIPVPPPVFYGVGFAAGLVIARWIPLAFARPRPVLAVGGLLIAAGVALALAGVVTVLRNKTTIVPHRPVSTLVTAGPYRLSRNPMYAGLALAYAGSAIAAGSAGPLLTLPLVLLALTRLAIRPEERYLTRRYPDEYVSYRRHVRRWL